MELPVTIHRDMIPSEHEEELLPSEGDGALEQAAQGGGGVSFSGFKTRLCWGVARLSRTARCGGSILSLA